MVEDQREMTGPDKPSGETRPTMRQRIDAWLDGSLTRRRIIPAHIVLVVAIAGAFFLLQQQRETSSITTAEVARALAVQEFDRCVNAVDRADGLRFNLNEIYDVLGVLYDEIDAAVSDGNPGAFDEALQRLRDRNDSGRSEIDVRYPERTATDCVATPLLGAKD